MPYHTVVEAEVEVEVMVELVAEEAGEEQMVDYPLLNSG
jgi:hypothetical protein